MTATRAGFDAAPARVPPTLTPDPAASVFAASAGVVDRFSALVHAMLDDGVLRQSARRALFRKAHALGIGRFEANLIIAGVQNRRPRSGPPPARPLSTPTPAGIAVAAVVLLQSIVVVAAWCFWHA